MNYEIRRMSIEDIPLVMELEKEFFSEPWSVNMFLEEIINHESFILVLEKELIGYICGWEFSNEYRITNLCISKKYHRQGWAEKLVRFIITEIEKKNIYNFFLEVRKSNLPAIKLYEKLKFIQIGIRKLYYKNPEEDAVIMKYES